MIALNDIPSIRWYRQSGAGIPLCIGMPFLGITGRMYRRTGFYFPNDIAVFHANQWYHYFDCDLARREADAIIERAITEESFFNECADDFLSAAGLMEHAGFRLLNKTGSHFEHEYGIFLEQSLRVWENSLFIDLLDPFEDIIIDRIFGEARGRLSKKELNRVLSPSKMSHIQKEKADLLSIAAIASRRGLDSSEVATCLKDHSKNYYWLKNNYEREEYLDEAYFRNQLHMLAEQPESAIAIAAEIREFEKLQEEKKTIISRYGFDDRAQKLLRFFTWLTAYRDDRKKYNQICNYVLIRLAERLASECTIDANLLNFALPDELPRILRRDRAFRAELERRSECGIVMCAGKLPPYSLTTGSVVREYFAALEAATLRAEIRGVTASLGKAIGSVRIIGSQADFSKMQDGDVLVASMTRPEYVPIMKKAAAIICDEGGITCHAAIVSRELRIPCVIGTQTATRLLADGDVVDVDADHGIIKIVSKAK